MSTRFVCADICKDKGTLFTQTDQRSSFSQYLHNRTVSVFLQDAIKTSVKIDWINTPLLVDVSKIKVRPEVIASS